MVKLNNISNSLTLSTDVTHSDAKKEPLHSWFPYLEGFSETFIDNIIKGIPKSQSLIYEPFSGSGTVPVYCKRNGIDCFFSEVNPFLIELTNLKLSVFELDDELKKKLSNELKNISSSLDQLVKKHPIDKELKKRYFKTFEKSIYFEEKNFNSVLKLSSFLKQIEWSVLKDFIRIAICNCLLPSSLLKRAGDVRYKRGREKINIPDTLKLVSEGLSKIAMELDNFDMPNYKVNITSNTNSKNFDDTFIGQVDSIITSPPYLNGTNYIRNTKLELWFLGYLKEKKDLSVFRNEVVTSGINDVIRDKKQIDVPIITDILNNAELWYDRRIPKMINDYFYDMDIVIENMHKYLKDDGLVFLDIGDSVYANQHIPTDLILLELFERRGFNLIENLKLRDRRSKSGKIVKQTLLVLNK